jgi:hypothetical protein
MDTSLFFEKMVLACYVILSGAVLIGVLRFKTLNNDQRILFFLLILTSLVQLSSTILWKYKMNNLFLYHFYTVAEFLLLGVLYAKHLNGLVKTTFMQGLMFAFVILALINTLFFQSLNEFNSNITFTESLLMIVFSVLFFYKLLRDLQHRKLERVPIFWINMSVLTYFSGALILFHVSNELISIPKEEREIVWGTHAVFSLVHYFLYAVALWVKQEQT